MFYALLIALKENRTVTACAITAVVVSKLTYNVTVDHCIKKVSEFVDKNEREKDVLKLQNAVLRDFISQQDLSDEFIETLRDLNIKINQLNTN